MQSAAIPASSQAFSTGGPGVPRRHFELLPEHRTGQSEIVPREFYLKLITIRNHMLAALSVVMLLLSAGAIAILRSIKHAQEQITRESLKMNAFDFSPTQTTSPFRDVSEVLESLEKAKTAMRAMGKYAPVDLSAQALPRQEGTCPGRRTSRDFDHV